MQKSPIKAQGVNPLLALPYLIIYVPISRSRIPRPIIYPVISATYPPCGPHTDQEIQADSYGQPDGRFICRIFSRYQIV
jgi:hypothetical protein